MTEPACLRIPLREYPGMSRFILDWLAGAERATSFLPRGIGESTQRIRKMEPYIPSASLVQALIDSNRRWGIFAGEQVRTWATGQTTTIIAGQQVGFAGGPLYTLTKLTTLVRMKRDLERAGQKVTAFFWLATEDHDFDEVAQLSLPVQSIGSDVNRQLNLYCVRARRAIEAKTMVGPQAVPEPLVNEFLGLYGMQRPEWLREGITFADSFAELVGAVFGNEIVLVDALLPELRRAGAGLFGAIAGRWNDIDAAIAQQSRDLQEAGYAPQVAPRDNGSYTLLFEIDHRGDRHILEAPRDIEAERISTSALTRPLLQDFVLRPDVFIGGPAEVSYYAQLSPVYAMLGVPMPRVALRAHALVAPQRIVRSFERYGVRPSEIFSSADAFVAEREPAAVAEIQRIAGEAREQLLAHIEKLADIALPAQHSLARAFNKSVGHIEYHFNKLAERSVKALVRKDAERYAAAREMIATLYPDGHVQDRIVGWFPFWAEHGARLIERLVDEVEPDSATFKVVGL